MSKEIVWTPEMDAALRQCKRDGLNDFRAAERIGVDHNTLGKRRRLLKIPALKAGRPRK